MSTSLVLVGRAGHRGRWLTQLVRCGRCHCPSHRLLAPFSHLRYRLVLQDKDKGHDAPVWRECRAQARVRLGFDGIAHCGEHERRVEWCGAIRRRVCPPRIVSSLVWVARGARRQSLSGATETAS